MARLAELHERLTETFQEWLRENPEANTGRDIGKGLGLFVSSIQQQLLSDLGNQRFERGFADMLALQTYAECGELRQSFEVH